MMLSTVELGLTETANSIWRINDLKLEPGSDLIAELNLDDWILEYEITPNRADCLSVIGLAYQICAATGRKITIEKKQFKTDAAIDIADKIKITIKDFSDCPRYTGNYVENISVKPADALMQTRLFQCGLRAINNIVDITNYVMLEYGQPLHAFDYDLIQGKEIIVRRSQNREIIKTIDGQERICDSSILVIADRNRPTAVAGVMGGFDSEVTDKTVKTLIESAFFNPVSVRKSSRLLGLSSESSYRFERGIDYSTVVDASEKAVFLIQKNCPDARISKNIADVFESELKQDIIRLEYSNVKRIIGVEIDKTSISLILKNLYCEIIEENETGLTVKTPMRRTDIKREIDLIEEIAVLYGYGNIPETPPVSDLSLGHLSGKQKFFIDLLKLFVDKGFYECVNYSFTDPDLNKDFSADYDAESVVKLSNPLGKEISVMRSSLIPSLIRILQNNVKYRNSGLNFFEIGKKYAADCAARAADVAAGAKVAIAEVAGASAFVETNTAAFILSEKTTLSNWDDKPLQIDFFYAKGVLDSVFEILNIKNCEYKTNNGISFLQPGQRADILYSGKKIGFLGKIHPLSAQKYDLPENIFICELNADLLFDNYVKAPAYNEFSIFPYTVRDMSLLIPKTTELKKVLEKIYSLKINILENAEFGGIYHSETIDKNYSAVLLKFTYRAKDKTLTDAEIESAHKSVFGAISAEFGILYR